MARIKFNKVPNLRGKLETSLTLRLFPKDSSELAKIKKMLTVKNKSVQYNLNRAQKARTRDSQRLQGLKDLNTPEDLPIYQKLVLKIEGLDREIIDLQGRVIETYYEEDFGTLLVPAGFWWLCETIDGNAHYNRTLDKFYLPELRPYQVECLDEMYKYSRATVELFTGAGKSKVIASVALAGVKSNKRVVIVVPTEYLVGQMYKQLKAMHPKTTALGGEYKHVAPGWDILVTTVNSASKIIDEAEVLLFDESHHAPCETWLNLATSAVKATNVYNFTATAFRADGLDLAIHAFGGPIVYSKDAKWGLDNKWLCPLKVIQIRMQPRKSDGSPMFFNDMVMAQRAYSALATNSDVMKYTKDRLQAALEKNHRVICLFKTVKAAMYFKKWCKGMLDFGVAHADKKISKNPKYPLHQFNKGETNLLVACDKLVGEGVDIPDSSLLLLLTQHTSDITTLQVVGRILRLAEGKEKAIVLDIALGGYAQFARAANKRLSIYRYLTDDVTVVDV